MQKIIQIAVGGNGHLFGLTDDGKVHQGYYKGSHVTWQELTAPPPRKAKEALPVNEATDQSIPSKEKHDKKGPNK